MVIRSIEDNTDKENEAKGKVIRNMRIARRLLAVGGEDVRIIDIKPDKMDPAHMRSVAVFRDDEKFQDIFSSVIEENRRNRENEIEKKSQKQIDELTKQVEELKKMLNEKE